MEEIVSFGIICVRKKEKYEFVQVKKNCTYDFHNFTVGKHRKLKKMFNKMTAEEKNIISSKNFEFVYFKCFKETLSQVKNIKKYNKYKNIFDKLVNSDKFDEKIKYTKNNEDIWEFPKGRLMPNENPIVGAIREFEEETGIIPVKYKVLLEEDPIILYKQDGKTIYKSILYLAVYLSLHDDFVFKNDYDYEISEKSWKTIEDKQLKKKIINKVKKYINKDN